MEELGYTATRHQREVGAGYFDLVSTAVSPDSSTLALKGSTEEAQFEEAPSRRSPRERAGRGAGDGSRRRRDPDAGGARLRRAACTGS